MSHIREEAIMLATVDERRAKDRTISRADLAEDAAVILMLFSGVVIAAALIVAALVI
jgi:hypothetical protein